VLRACGAVGTFFVAVIPAKAGVFTRGSDIQERCWGGKGAGFRVEFGMTIVLKA
jgi:hypothetical protein